MESIGHRVPPELIDAALKRPAPRRTVAEIEIRCRPARDCRRGTLARREPVLELAGRKQLGQHTVGAVELADLAERSIGDEVDRVLAVSHGKIDGEAACRVVEIKSHEIPAEISPPGPPRL